MEVVKLQFYTALSMDSIEELCLQLDLIVIRYNLSITIMLIDPVKLYTILDLEVYTF